MGPQFAGDLPQQHQQARDSQDFDQRALAPAERRHGLGNAPAGSVLPLLDDAEAGMRAYLVSLPRSATVEAPFAHKGAELVGVVSGLVQVLLSSGRPILRRGETLLASRRGIDGWRNMGESEAQCLWVLRD